MKKPDPAMMERQQELENSLAALESTRDEITVKIRAGRKRLDDFIKANGDAKAKMRGWERHQEWLKKVENTPKPTEEEIAALKKKNEDDLRSKIGIWWDAVENGVPIPFPIHIRWLQEDKMGPLEKHEVWPKATMGTLLVRFGAFDSTGDAQRAGKNPPLSAGEHRIKHGFTMKRFIIHAVN